MLFSEEWLRHYINPALSSDELCETLTMGGLEIEGAANSRQRAYALLHRAPAPAAGAGRQASRPLEFRSTALASIAEAGRLRAMGTESDWHRCLQLSAPGVEDIPVHL